MIGPVFLTVDDVLQLHEDALEQDGGSPNHAFVDGNKRTALLATLVFLGLNGHVLDRDDQRLDDAVLAVAIGSIDRDGAAAVLRAVAGVT